MHDNHRGTTRITSTWCKPSSKPGRGTRRSTPGWTPTTTASPMSRPKTKSKCRSHPSAGLLGLRQPESASGLTETGVVAQLLDLARLRSQQQPRATLELSSTLANLQSDIPDYLAARPGELQTRRWPNLAGGCDPSSGRNRLDVLVNAFEPAQLAVDWGPLVAAFDPTSSRRTGRNTGRARFVVPSRSAMVAGTCVRRETVADVTWM